MKRFLTKFKDLFGLTPEQADQLSQIKFPCC